MSVLLKSPVANGTISSSFGERDGKFHQGLDIAADTDTPITASLTGTVKKREKMTHMENTFYLTMEAVLKLAMLIVIQFLSSKETM